MAARSRAQFEKRRKELARQERQKEKRARRQAARDTKATTDPDGAAENPEDVGSPLEAGSDADAPEGT